MREHACTGVLWIHSAPQALQPHLVWAIARAGFTTPEGLRPERAMWRVRPDNPHNSHRPHDSHRRICAELSWRAQPGAAEQLVSDLERWPDLTFELAVDAPIGGNGARYCRVPELGMYAAVTDDIGNVVLNENTIRSIMRRHEGDSAAMTEAMDEALGGPWDQHLEALRPGTAGYADDEWIIAPCDVVHLDNVRDIRDTRAVM
ncbi:DUF3145 family protein [Corynebacterium sp. H113]|uniref:DUF3145 family protein n=1 Tax=Corynebacterium sp. H113 TaxID=3133419 RepID=UPI0030B38DA6